MSAHPLDLKPQDAAPPAPITGWRSLFAVEDWWSIWIGLGLLAAALLLYSNGSSIRWLAVAPAKWHELPQALAQLADQAPRYGALFAVFAALFALAAGALGQRVGAFLGSFAILFAASALIFLIGQWDQADRYNLEPPLVALGLGLLIANTTRLPAWFSAGLRVEFFVKIGIVLLGATLPLTLVLWAGPVAMVQAAIVSLATFFTIYLVATRLGLDRRFAATLGTGGAVCGVSGSIAVAGAVGAKREDVSVSITLVIFWAIVFIFALPLISRSLGLPTGVAGAWIGTSEFADAAGFAAAQAYGGYAGQVPGIAGHADASVQAFTLMKVIGRDMWIGIWALVLSIVATTRWDNADGVARRAGAGEIWRRFPKFVLGFLIASAVVALVSQGISYAEYKKSVVPQLVGPVKDLRTWCFIFSFLSIGLSTRVRELAAAAKRPLIAFTAGVVVNVVLGYVLSTQIFGEFWTRFGQ